MFAVSVCHCKNLPIVEFHVSIAGAVVVIICSAIIVFCKENDSIQVRLIDPLMSLVSIGILLGLSYPYSKLEDFISKHFLNFRITSLHSEGSRLDSPSNHS